MAVAASLQLTAMSTAALLHLAVVVAAAVCWCGGSSSLAAADCNVSSSSSAVEEISSTIYQWVAVSSVAAAMPAVLSIIGWL